MGMAVSDVFVKYLEDAAGLEKASVALASISSPGKTSIRSNPLKPCSMAVLGGHASAVPWAECGLFLEGRPVFTLDPCFHAGAYYVQDSSSMFVGHVFSEAVKITGGQGIKILDLCAAPGGKTTDIASRMPSGSVLVANEVVRQRASVLKDNVETWGHPDVIVTSSDPSDFGRRMKDYFDIILVDAPCSGEGMFRKDRLALEQWSEDAVALCSARQKRILADVWPSLKPGGMLIYSTCTFNRHENGNNVKWMSETLGAEIMEIDSPEAEAAGAFRDDIGGLLFVYGMVPGEGQYCALVRKTGDCVQERGNVKRHGLSSLPESLGRLFDREMYLLQDKRSPESVIAASKYVATAASSLAGAVKIVSAGIRAGVFKGKDFVPDPALALSSAFDRTSYPVADIDRGAALKFLARESFFIGNMPKGYVVICHDGLPLGFVKNIGNRMNNLHPPGRRIRMDINV